MVSKLDGIQLSRDLGDISAPEACHQSMGEKRSLLHLSMYGIRSILHHSMYGIRSVLHNSMNGKRSLLHHSLVGKGYSPVCTNQEAGRGVEQR